MLSWKWDIYIGKHNQRARLVTGAWARRLGSYRNSPQVSALALTGGGPWHQNKSWLTIFLEHSVLI